jgi:type VI secretion system protein ImpK
MAPQPGSPTPARRHENLALAFQEILTAAERLRTGRQSIADAAAFRYQILEGLKAADQQARTHGYHADDIKLAVFAVVAFVDESVLNLRSPAFADWPRRPLQEELFGHHVAGEVFFKNLQGLLGKIDSPDLADLLEVYHLCLLLGFAGRYSLGGRGELRAVGEAVAEKIRRIRGAAGEISPAWALPPEAVRRAGTDPLVRKFGIAAAACGLLAVILLVVYQVILGSGVSSLRDLAGKL